MNRLRAKVIAAWAVLLTALTLQTNDAAAWGAQGHRLTALIAYQLLSPSAQARVNAILGSNDLAGASLYLDIHRDELEQAIPGSKTWHYDNRPTCEPDVPRADYCAAGHCASAQLQRHYRVLADPRSPLARKRFALQVIAHLTGDIHQPLHAADHHDAGGNAIKLTGTWNGKANLHSVWDNDFVARAFASPDFDGQSESQIAAVMASQITAAQKQAWRQGPVTAWLQDSHAIAVNTAYGLLPGFACHGTNLDAMPVTLTDDYIDRSVGTVPEQLKKGGVRLAAILNRALSKGIDASDAFVRADKLSLFREILDESTAHRHRLHPCPRPPSA